MNAPSATLARTAVLFAAALATSTASAQVLSYHHRSTVLGDHLSGYAEVLHADGLNARNRALAYQTLIRAQREREVLRQEKLAAYHYEKQFAQQQIRDKAAANRARQQAEAEQTERESRFLLEDVQARTNVWPHALRRPEFAGQMLQVESILRDFDAPYPSDIRALRLIADGLRTEIANATDVSFRDRVEAIATLKQIEYLAHRRDAAPLGNHGGPQLAQR